MAKQVEWNSVIYQEFCRLAMLSDDEKKILKTRIQGYTVRQQACEFHKGESTVAEIIRVLKLKYDSVQPLSDKLPVRKKSKKELYMDTH